MRNDPLFSETKSELVIRLSIQNFRVVKVYYIRGNYINFISINICYKQSMNDINTTQKI